MGEGTVGKTGRGPGWKGRGEAGLPFALRFAVRVLGSRGAPTPGAWQWVGDQLGCAGLEDETGPGILEPDSCPAWSTDYERTPAFQLPVPAQ